MSSKISGQYRQHHYHFAHNVVPSLFYTHPINFMGALHFEDCFLANIWELSAKDRGLTGEDVLSDEHLKSVEYRDVENNFLANIITMPPAKNQAEAIMICMLAKVRLNPKRQLEAIDQIVFTLEHGGDEDGVSNPYFCTWSKSGDHTNLGRKNIETAEEFLALCKHTFKPVHKPRGLLKRIFRR